MRERQARYQLTEKGRATRLRYEATEKGKANEKRYAASAKRRAVWQRYNHSEAGAMMRKLHSRMPKRRLLSMLYQQRMRHV